MKRGSVVVAMGVLWAAYALGCMGYFWIRGYDIGFREMVDPLNWYDGEWPPGKAPATSIIPASKAKGGSTDVSVT